MGADILLLNLFDVQQPVIHGLPPVEPGETIRLLKKLTGRPIGINLEPVADDAEIETDPCGHVRRASCHGGERSAGQEAGH